MMHTNLEPISFLIGTWSSISAQGSFPTINSFNYKEELVFESSGQPLLNYSSKSYHPNNNRPMHFESGFMRIQNGTEIALISAHNFGICSIEEGTLSDKKISLRSTNISRVSFAKEPAVTALKRDISLLDENTLEIVTEMSTTTTSDLTKHLQVIYKKKTN